MFLKMQSCVRLEFNKGVAYCYFYSNEQLKQVFIKTSLFLFYIFNVSKLMLYWLSLEML